MKQTTLYHPVGPLGYRRLQHQPDEGLKLLAAGRRYFFPLLSPFQATLIARRWYLPRHGCAWVCRFTVATEALYPYPHKDWSNSGRDEYRIPSQNLPTLTSHLIAPVEIIQHLTLKHTDIRLMQRLLSSHSLVSSMQRKAPPGQKPLPFLEIHR